MYCPSCGNLLQKLTVTTTSGGKFDVEHCGRCGGSWFDPYEINRIPYHEVIRIAHLTVLPQNPPVEPSLHKCPRCHKNLVVSHYESVPKGVKMLRCPKCGGIWATQRALENFKKHQEEKIQEFKSGITAFPSLSVVFVPALLVLMLFLVTFSTVTSLLQSKESRIKAEENISGLTTLSLSSTSIDIIFQTKTAVISSISYGVDPFSFENKTINHQPSTNHSVILTNLKPKTIYTFKITLIDNKGHSFTTSENSFILLSFENEISITPSRLI